MNIFTVLFWQLAQMAILVALGAIELRNPWMLALAPPAVWEPFIVILVLGNLAWVLAAAIWGSDAAPPQIDVRRVRRSLAQRLFPPPPAARHAYASRTKRQRRIVP